MLGAALVQQLSSQGLNPYYIPVGGSSALGVWGYLQAVEELREQTQELGLKFDVIASVSGSLITVIRSTCMLSATRAADIADTGPPCGSSRCGCVGEHTVLVAPSSTIPLPYMPK